MSNAKGKFKSKSQRADRTSKAKGKSKSKLNIGGPEDQSLFHGLKAWAFVPTAVEELKLHIKQELEHVQGLNDDRVLVLLGGLIVENALDGFLAAIMPSYKGLRDNRDFTFAMRIEIARALKLVPTKILTGADVIRRIRNDFVHNLSTDTFGKLTSIRLQSLRDRLAEFKSIEADVSHAEAFKKLASYTAVALYGYRVQAIHLNDFIRSPDFMLKLREHIEDQQSAPSQQL